MEKIKDFLLDLKEGFSNLYNYFTIIWDTREWDYFFLETLLLFKLRRLYKCIYEENNVLVEHKSKIALRIVIRLLEDDISDIHFNRYYNKLKTNNTFDLVNTIEKQREDLFYKLYKQYRKSWWN